MRIPVQILVQRTARNPIGWFLYRTCGRLSEHLGWIYGHAQFVRQGSDSNEIAKFTAQLFPDLTVANGPFKGLRYPSAQALGSTLLLKLLGAYESHLHPVLERMLSNGYTTVVDIDCAEGITQSGSTEIAELGSVRL